MSQIISSKEQTEQTLPQASPGSEPVVAKLAVAQLDQQAPSRPAAKSRFRWIPPVLTFCSLAALGYWGHQTDWKLPSFSDASGQSLPPGEVWCEEHSVLEAECRICQPPILPVSEDFESNQSAQTMSLLGIMHIGLVLLQSINIMVMLLFFNL